MLLLAFGVSHCSYLERGNSIMRRLLESGRARAAAIDHLELLLKRAISLGEQLDLALLAHDGLAELLQ